MEKIDKTFKMSKIETKTSDGQNHGQKKKRIMHDRTKPDT